MLAEPIDEVLHEVVAKRTRCDRAPHHREVLAQRGVIVTQPRDHDRVRGRLVLVVVEHLALLVVEVARQIVGELRPHAVELNPTTAARMGDDLRETHVELGMARAHERTVLDHRPAGIAAHDARRARSFFAHRGGADGTGGAKAACAFVATSHTPHAMTQALEFERQRRAMVRTQLLPRGIHDPRVLEAMGRVRREEFVPPAWRDRAYDDGPLPLDGATISQPFIVAYMSELARIQPGDRVLEAGTGSGYQAAVLCELGAEVFTIEVRSWLAEEARRRLAALGYDRVHVRVGNAFSGWPEEAPFDAIVVTAAVASVPRPLFEQLADGGRLVAPVGSPGVQDLLVYVRDGDQLHEHVAGPVAFVPFVEPPAA